MQIPTHSYLQSISLESFPEGEVKQAFYTRHGGVSPEPWASLNHGGTVGDERENVVENRKRIFDHFERPVESIYDVWQVHSADVVCVDQPRSLSSPHLKADAILTDHPNITLMMRFADCVPILFYEPNKRVIGIAHAGWQGTIKMIGKAVVEKMVEQYQCMSSDIIAGIGPSIGPDCYEVGMDVFEKIHAAFGKRSLHVLSNKNGNHYFNLWQANRMILEEAGVQNVEVMEICTACHTEDWYSHRAERGKTGRFGALIALM
jgi:YfiH family protein